MIKKYISQIYFLLLNQKKVSKKNQEIAKAIAINCDHQTKAKMSTMLQHFLTLLFEFAAPISLNKKINYQIIQKLTNDFLFIFKLKILILKFKIRNIKNQLSNPFVSFTKYTFLPWDS
jgi:hypothetical protein